MKKRKPIAKVGKKSRDYTKWRDTVAKPFLDDYYGHTCAVCGTTENLDVDHIKNRGSHPELVCELTNVQYLCRTCHYRKTNEF